MTGERLSGLTRHNARPLLKVIGHRTRSDCNRAKNAARHERPDSMSDRADTSKLKPASPSKKRQRSDDDTKAISGIPRIDSIDGLANANAPTAAAGVGGRSRQAGGEPLCKGRPVPASQTTRRTLALSEEELASTTSFSTCSFFGGISAGKDILQAKNGAMQTYSRRATKEPDSTWDGFGSRKGGSKSRPVPPFGRNPKGDCHFPYSKQDADGMFQGATYKPGLKVSKPPNTNAPSDSDKDTVKRKPMISKKFRTFHV